MKILTLSTLATALLTLSAEARDSTWLLCSNEDLAVNVLEHRSGATTRATELNMIYGVYYLVGKLKNVDAGPVKLKNSRSQFNGTVAVDYSSQTIALKGQVNLEDVVTIDLDHTLACKKMDGESL